MAEYSARYPKLGIASAGKLYAPATPARPTVESGCSSWEGVWPTPVASDDNKSPEAHMAMRRGLPGGERHTCTSLNVLTKAIDRGYGTDPKLWPTPNCSDGLGGRMSSEEVVLSGKRPSGAKAQISLGAAAKHWPTVNDAGNATAPPSQAFRHTPGLASQVGMWPTPSAINANDGEGLATWEARRQRIKAEKKNGNGMGTPLAIAIQMWPTPRAGDGPKGGPNQRGSSGDLMLPSAVQGLVPGLLNPAWVEILVGLPIGWTDLDVPNDALGPWPGWPSPPGIGQMPYEPARTGTGIKARSKRLKALGNVCLSQQVLPIFEAIMAEEGGHGATVEEVGGSGDV